MPPVTGTQRRDLPVWVVAACVAAIVLVVGYWGFSVMSGRGANPGQSIEVRPGMYDIRAEAAKARASNPNPGTVGGGGDGK